MEQETVVWLVNNISVGEKILFPTMVRSNRLEDHIESQRPNVGTFLPKKGLCLVMFSFLAPDVICQTGGSQLPARASQSDEKCNPDLSVNSRISGKERLRFALSTLPTAAVSQNKALLRKREKDDWRQRRAPAPWWQTPQ